MRISYRDLLLTGSVRRALIISAVITVSGCDSTFESKKNIKELVGINSVSDKSSNEETSFIADISKPKTPNDLMSNVKFIIKYNLLLNTTFYSEESLTKFLGGSEFRRWENDIKTEKMININHMGRLFEYTERYTGMGADITIKLTAPKKEEEQHILSSHLVFGFGADSRLNIDVVEALFGQDHETADYISGYEASVRSWAPTNRYGNKYITYSFDDENAHSRLSFVFNFDGGASSFNLTQERR